MTSPSGASGHLGSELARDFSAPMSSNTQSPRSTNSDDSQREHDQNNLDQNTDEEAICQWRTSRFFHQECSQYFDCPSHTIERSLSETGEADQQSIHSSHSPEISRPDNNQGLADEPTSRFTEQELAHVENDIEDPQITPADDTDDDRDATSAASDPSTNTEDTGTVVAQQPEHGSNAQQNTRQNIEINEVESSSQNRRSEQHETPNPPSEHPEHRHRSSQSTSVTNAQTTQRTYATPSRERMDAPLPSLRPLEEALPPLPRSARQSVSSDSQRPRWQPDNEVTYCPICHTQFSFFVRKHHCRKCGRVVCNSCSPHRIIIPHQYIVRPPGSEAIHQSLLVDGLGAGYFDVNDMSGGERVRLCNPCVPDPNTAPPQSPGPQATLSPRAPHQRSRSSIGDAYGTLQPSNRHGAVFAPGTTGDPYRYLSPRMRSVTMGSASSGSSPGPSHRRRSGAHQTPIERFLSSAQAASPSSYPERYSSLGESSSRQRALPPTPQIAEEDECPICHRELPSQSLPNAEALRESHITTCIQTHSTYGTPRGGEGGAPVAPRRTGMYTYVATEKDCIDDAECTICLEEFTVGVPMARLECLCRFHRACISSWFVKHPGRCPVHQHDGFGY